MNNKNKVELNTKASTCMPPPTLDSSSFTTLCILDKYSNKYVTLSTMSKHDLLFDIYHVIIFSDQPFMCTIQKKGIQETKITLPQLQL